MGDRGSGPAVVFVAILIASMLTLVTLWPGQLASYELTKDIDPLDHDAEDEMPFELPYPVGFTENLGQMDDGEVLFHATTAQGGIVLLESEMRLTLVRGDVIAQVTMTFPGSRSVEPVPTDRLPGVTNYLLGNDPTCWVRGAATFSEAVYRNLWQGIDLTVKNDREGVKYAFILDPGADPSWISIHLTGHEAISIGDRGDIEITTIAGDIVDAGLKVFYEDDPEQAIKASFALLGSDTYAYKLGHYDTQRTLIIDPLIHSTFLGGNNSDYLEGIAVDDQGYVYLAGVTNSQDLQLDLGFNTTTPIRAKSFIKKIDPLDGSQVFTTLIGGNESTWINDLHVDFLGFIYVTGETLCEDFPVTVNAYQNETRDRTSRQQSAFVCKLSRDGSTMLYSTLLGGRDSDEGVGITTDLNGIIYFIGETWSPDFPTTDGAYQERYGGNWGDAFIGKIDPKDGYVHYVTYLGGNSDDDGEDIRADQEGNAIIAGYTWSRNFPTTGGAPYPTFKGGQSDAFIAMLSPDGTQLLRSTLLGGSDRDRAYALDIDAEGNSYICGITDSADLPTTDGAFMENIGTNKSAFVAKLTSDWTSFDYVTYVGGGHVDTASDIVVDRQGCAYITGTTCSETLFTTDEAVKRELGGGSDAFIQKLNSYGKEALYSTYLGGNESEIGYHITIDTEKSIYVTGITWSSTFPVSEDAMQPDYGGGQIDGYFTHLDSVADEPSPSTVSNEWTLVLIFLFLSLLVVTVV
ncbi:MAG: SBBP repeat-containing protein, partial [Candidatus Thermoplasmatota archaeon]|nr:SBBP repeat-containing protein [Candidatus Thermoplasmatota archaeon]